MAPVPALTDFSSIGCDSSKLASHCGARLAEVKLTGRTMPWWFDRFILQLVRTHIAVDAILFFSPKNGSMNSKAFAWLPLFEWNCSNNFLRLTPFPQYSESIFLLLVLNDCDSGSNLHWLLLFHLNLSSRNLELLLLWFGKDCPESTCFVQAIIDGRKCNSNIQQLYRFFQYFELWFGCWMTQL